MNRFNPGRVFRLGMTVFALISGLLYASAKPPKAAPDAITLIVMDPLAKEMACACVKGHGQRDYRKLAARLEKAIEHRVAVEFSDDLAESMKLIGPGQQVIVVGEESLVTHGAKMAGLKSHPICALTDPEGETTLTGLFVARANDPALELKDLRGRKILFGVSEADAQYGAALTALRSAGVELPAKIETRAAYSDAALDVLDSQSAPPPVALIPGYALPLLEGCGSMKPRDLKVIGKTQGVPFITVFVSDTIAAETTEKVLKTLLEIKGDAKLLKLMESKEGFKPLPAEKNEAKTSAKADWPDWRGPNRDGHVPRLPARLPEKPNVLWRKAAMIGGLAGLSVSDGRLIVAERDFADENDVYRCMNADTGELLWSIDFSAAGKLDYGQFPRATPVIHKGNAYLLGAFGELRCVDVTDGKTIWKRVLPREFKAELPTWGMCSTPLIVDDMLIVNPGGTNASVVALDCATGKTRWATPGRSAAYSAFIGGEFGGRRQIVGYDHSSLGGWDVKTGERLWELIPPTEGDFNVPTPVPADGGVILSTENNGTRFHRFDTAGIIIQKPVAEFGDLSPDTATPVTAGGRLFASHHGLHCLDVKNGLKPIWHRDEAVGDHGTLIADDERVLVITLAGELILLDAKADAYSILSRLKVFEDDVEVYSHPALVGTRLYIRGGTGVMCVDLATN